MYFLPAPRAYIHLQPYLILHKEFYNLCTLQPKYISNPRAVIFLIELRLCI